MNKIKGLHLFVKIAGLLFIAAIIFAILGLILIGSAHIGNYDGFKGLNDLGVSNVIGEKGLAAAAKLVAPSAFNTMKTGAVFAVVLAPLFAGLAIVIYLVKHFLKK